MGPRAGWRWRRLDGLAVHQTHGLRVFRLHGRQDTLVPFTETLRLAALLPRPVRPALLVTRFFGHAKAAQAKLLRDPGALGREAWRFTATVARLLAAVGR